MLPYDAVAACINVSSKRATSRDFALRPSEMNPLIPTLPSHGMEVEVLVHAIGGTAVHGNPVLHDSVVLQKEHPQRAPSIDHVISEMISNQSLVFECR
jgi:hypothetical protein